jgi:hypothetical protein
MGSWTELDAYYPEGTLTPATAFVVALGHLAGKHSVYATGESGRLANFVPRPERGLIADRDLITRAERYLRDVPLETFLAEARAVLNPQQMRTLLLNLRSTAEEAPESHARYQQIIAGIGAPGEQHDWPDDYKNDLSIFPQ